MNVFCFGQHLQRRCDIVAGVDIQMQQVEGLYSDAGFCPGSFHRALQCPSKDLTGEGSATLYVFLAASDIAFALA